MKKTLIVAVCVILVAVLVLPTVALATPGKGGGKGQLGNAASIATSGVPTPGARPGRGNAFGLTKNYKGAVTGSGTTKPGKRLGSLGTTPPAESVVPSRSVLSSGSAAGIGNALSRIQANIAKAQAKVAAGAKKQVPPGLLRVMAKFMAWLGLTPPAAAPSPVPTSTPVPTAAPVPTSTPAP